MDVPPCPFCNGEGSKKLGIILYLEDYCDEAVRSGKASSITRLDLGENDLLYRCSNCQGFFVLESTTRRTITFIPGKVDQHMTEDYALRMLFSVM